MARTDTLRRQHDAAVALVSTVQGLLPNYCGQTDAAKIAMSLAKLDGLLRIHFAQEDRSLYPAMVANGDPEVSETARAYQDEMGGLSETFAKFVARWSNSGSIAGNFPLFRNERGAVFAALANRIERENDHLYALADGMTVRSAA